MEKDDSPIIIEEDSENQEALDNEEELEDVLEGISDSNEDVSRTSISQTAPILEQNVEESEIVQPLEQKREERETENMQSYDDSKTIYEEAERREGGPRQVRRIFNETREINMVGMPTMNRENRQRVGMLEIPEIERGSDEYSPAEVEARKEELKMPWEQERKERRARMLRDYE